MTSLVVQWLWLCASNARDSGLIPGEVIKIPHAVRCGQKEKSKKNVYKANGKQNGVP